jgi:hypothetical protein
MIRIAITEAAFNAVAAMLPGTASSSAGLLQRGQEVSVTIIPYWLTKVNGTSFRFGPFWWRVGWPIDPATRGEAKARGKPRSRSNPKSKRPGTIRPLNRLVGILK